MKEERTIYCEGPECETHQKTGRPYGKYPLGWISVFEHLNGFDDEQYAFCGWDCAMKFAAQNPPPIVIAWDDVPGVDES